MVGTTEPTEAIDSPAAAQPPIPAFSHAPAVPSSLNPTSSKLLTHLPPPMQREQREKRDSLKKRESNLNHANDPSTSTSSSLGKRKAAVSFAVPSPLRFNNPPPKAQDFEAPKEDSMAPHEPFPLLMPDSQRQLYKPIDLAENRRGYRYLRAVADPSFPHKQFYRSTSPPPHYSRLSFEDADRWMHFTTNALITTNEKGWRMVRSNVCAREGTLYYEIKIHRGVPEYGPERSGSEPQPHVRFGWARREAPLDAPVGFDGYSYGLTDIRFETVHRSRPAKIFHPQTTKNKSVKGGPTPVSLDVEDQHVKEGDVIGVEIQLPALTLHQKVVSGVYNPAADVGDGFDDAAPFLDPDVEVPDVVRDRVPIAYKGNCYFEVADYVATKPMEMYADRSTSLATVAQLAAMGAAPKDTIKAPPNPNHEMAQLRTLPHSAIRVYKDGKLIGTAFQDLLAFLPPASEPSKQLGARDGAFDDGMVGYFPAVSCFFGGIAEVNFGDGSNGFWAPPPHIMSTRRYKKKSSRERETGNGHKLSLVVEADPKKQGWNPGRRPRAIGDRFFEQVAEDIVWDIIDEVDFFMQDGGYEGTVGSGPAGLIDSTSRLRDE